MSKHALRERTKRVLSSRFREADFTALFLHMREHKFASPSVREVGDAIAHSTTRTRGATTQLTRHWANVINAKAPQIADSSYVPKLEEVRSSVQSCLWLLSEEEIYSRFGYGKAKAASLLGFACSAMTQSAGEHIEWSKKITPEQFALVEYLSSIIPVRPLFDENTLAQAFIDDLSMAELIEVGDRWDWASLRPGIARFAISVLHNTRISLSDSRVADLFIAYNPEENGISILASVPTIPGRGNFGFSIFSTLRQPKDTFSDVALSEMTSRFTIDYPLEIGDDGKLRRLDGSSYR